MARRDDLKRRLGTPLPAATLRALALEALDLGLFEEIVAAIERAVGTGLADDAMLFQLLGLSHRGLLDGAAASAAFARAAALAPGDARIAHGLARTRLEAGLPAVESYARALRLAPSDAGVLLGQAIALAAEGRAAAGEAALAGVLAQHPGWFAGHAAYAQLVAGARLPLDGTRTVRAALDRHPRDAGLWQTLLRTLLEARRWAEAIETAAAAERELGPSTEWTRATAAALSEQGEPVAAQRLLDALPPATTAAALVNRVRNLIRLGRLAEAAALAERRFAEPEDAALWPYRALLWRLLDDPRWFWLEGDPRLIGVYDLAIPPAELAELATVLAGLHASAGQLLDQSVRGGSQTDGQLLARAEPAIAALRERLLAAVRTHVGQLPAAEPDHPTLVATRAPVRIAGSWSVRLSHAGFHADHVHPLGWLSSAFYVTLPASGAMGGDDRAGWLTLGECRDLVPSLPPFRLVEPVAGRLVLFPSTMWHGTRPFAAGERLTVAFDVARP